MTPNKQALRVPERKRHDWSQSVMRDCDFCSQWSLTVKHENGGHIGASCCDAEYTSALKDALEMAIERADAAEKRIAELEARSVKLPTGTEVNGFQMLIEAEVIASLKEAGLNVTVVRAAGIKIKGE